MRVNVLLFGPFAAAAKDSAVTVDLHASACTAGDVKAQLAEQYPELARLLGPAVLAVNHRAVQPDHAIGEADELAIIGLVGGG